MHSDWQRLTLATWAKWVADNRPLAFSLYGDSVHAREMFRGRHRRSYRSDSPLWEETSLDWSLVMPMSESVRGASVVRCDRSTR